MANRSVRMIATEEAFATPEYLSAFNQHPLVETHSGLRNAKRFMGRPGSAERLTDFDVRLAEMDEFGVDMHLLSLTSPGVQIFDPDTGTELAALTNTRLAEAIRRHPTRFSGLGAVAPQDPRRAADEIGRSMNELGLNGIIINSHTNGEFLDEPKFDPILAAAARHRAPIYLHPTFPSQDMAKPFESYGLNSAIWSFGAECSLHAVRLIMSGAFDRHPDLQIVLGHMGEAIPFWLSRLDNLNLKLMRFDPLPEGVVRLARKPSEYFASNFHITTCGLFSKEALRYCIEVLGLEKILFSIDYPYEESKKTVEFIGNAGLSDHEYAAILHKNAERVFRIPPR